MTPKKSFDPNNSIILPRIMFRKELQWKEGYIPEIIGKFNVDADGLANNIKIYIYRMDYKNILINPEDGWSEIFLIAWEQNGETKTSQLYQQGGVTFVSRISDNAYLDFEKNKELISQSRKKIPTWHDVDNAIWPICNGQLMDFYYQFDYEYLESKNRVFLFRYVVSKEEIHWQIFTQCLDFQTAAQHYNDENRRANL